MNVTELIIAKRQGRELAVDEIGWLVNGYTRGDIPDYQMSAFLMAAFFKGMTPRETAAYTRAMIHSGEQYDLSSIAGVKVDKHSTGGVGDKVSLPLAPLVAAAGLPVPMMSGRGLGHSGGTLDKLESIPGFRVGLSREETLRQLAEVGFVMIGQTERVAPADKKLYALRDVTGTVESIPLICGSILSKKVAAGVQALVMDVKTGSGAFMRTQEDAEALAGQLVAIGTELGLRMVACVTDMDQPLGLQIGNALEMVESIECLRGGGPADLREIVLVLATEMIVMGGKATTPKEGRAMAERLLDSGAALARFRRMVELQGGDPAVVDHPEQLEIAPGALDVVVERNGYITEFETREVGIASNALGAGRAKITDAVDHGVGITLVRKRGDAVAKGDVLARIRHRGGHGLDEASGRLRRAIRIGEAPPPPRPLILKRIAKD